MLRLFPIILRLLSAYCDLSLTLNRISIHQFFLIGSQTHRFFREFNRNWTLKWGNLHLSIRFRTHQLKFLTRPLYFMGQLYEFSWEGVSKFFCQGGIVLIWKRIYTPDVVLTLVSSLVCLLWR